MTFQEVSGRRAVTPVSASAPREAGGPYGWLTPYVEAIAEHNEPFAARILRLRRAELHFIALCLSLMGEERNDADHLAAFARDYDRLPRRSLLANYIDTAGPAYSPKVVTLASKLAGRPWRSAGYVRLVKLFAEPHARKVLCHLSYITRWHVTALSRLPEPYRKFGVLRKIERRTDLPRVVFAIEIVRRVRTDLNDRQIVASLEKADTSYIRDWVERHYERLPFPQAPTGALKDGGGGVLRPVATGAELTRAAREFDNCVDNYLWEASSGASVFYRYDTGEKRIAIAELKRLPGIGWAVDELLAPRNRTLAGGDRARVLALFRKAGVLPAPQVVGSFSWFDLD